MSQTGYKPVQWNVGDNLTKERLNQMANNDQWLFDNLTRSDYQAFGVHRTAGIRIAAGTALIRTNTKPWGFTDVHFGNFFSSGSTPIITTGVVSAHIRRVFVTVEGFGQTQPTSEGFRIWVNTVNPPWMPNRLFAPLYCNFSAIGY